MQRVPAASLYIDATAEATFTALDAYVRGSFENMMLAPAARVLGPRRRHAIVSALDLPPRCVAFVPGVDVTDKQGAVGADPVVDRVVPLEPFPDRGLVGSRVFEAALEQGVLALALRQLAPLQQGTDC